MPLSRVRFGDEYRDAIGKVLDLSRDESFKAADEFLPILLTKLKDLSPKWSPPGDEYSLYYPQRDSERTGRPGTLEEGWRLRVNHTRFGGTVVIDHEDTARVDWIRFGTKRHDINVGPARKALFFWMKYPYKGAPRWFRMKYVDHPGMRLKYRATRIAPDLKGPGDIGNPSDFVAGAITEAMDEYDAKFNQAIPRVLLPLRRLFRERAQ